MATKIATPGPRRSGLPISSTSPSSAAASGRNSSLGQSSGSSSGGGGNAPTTPGQRLGPRKSQVGLRQAAAAAASTAASSGSTSRILPQTPRRSIPSAINGRATPTGDGSAVPPRKLEIGDEVYADVNSVRYIGVLRHLGPVHFRPGTFAGLELTGESEGKGRNDGCVEGQQYFACEPDNGIFFLAGRVKRLGGAPSTEATARPQSAMSHRSGRTSALDDDSHQAARPLLATPGRPRTSFSSASGRTTPSRPLSRSSVGRPSSRASRGNGAGNGTRPSLPTSSRYSSSSDANTEQDDGQRAKSSAQEAERAEERITEGSRAHKLLNLNAKDLRARRDAGMVSSAFAPSRKLAVSAGSSTLSSPPKSATSSMGSPLKQGLLGTKARASMGSSLPTPSATPRASKGRQSLQTNTNQAAMPPPSDFPPSPTKHQTGPRQTASRSASPNADPTALRNLSLLEQMDLLTPRRPTQPSPRVSESDGVSDTGQEFGRALAPSDDGYSNVDNAYEDGADGNMGVVPIALFQSHNMELMQLKTQLSETQRALDESQKGSINRLTTEVERAKIAALAEARKEVEEERRIEQDDNARRRKGEIEAKERDFSSQMDALKRESKKSEDEIAKARLEHERKVSELEARIQESDTLVQQLKSSVSTADSTKAQTEAAQLEITQLKERLDRVEAAYAKAQQDNVREVDDLKSAGQEALDLYVNAENESKERISELENNLHMLQARAQEAIKEAERQRDEAINQANDAAARSAATHDAISEIGQQSLQQQLEQAQTRVILLEDQVAEVNAVLVHEREAHVKRRDRYAEAEAKLREEVARHKKSSAQLEKGEAEARRRAEELSEALEESRATLENERAELETLRAEALIMGEGPDRQSVLAAEKNRFDAEIDRLQGLLEGARSGKREAARQADDLRVQNKELHALLGELRAHLRSMEAEREQTSDEAAARSESNAQNTARLRQDIDRMRASGKPPAEQIDSVLNVFEKEIADKDREIMSLRRKLNEQGSRLGLGYPSTLGSASGSSASRAASFDVERSPKSSSLDSATGQTVTSPGWSSTAWRMSSASSYSRRSYSSGPGAGTNGSHAINPLSTPEGAAKELAGLRSLVNTLNQELTEQKVSSTQRERELRDQVEKAQAEVRRLHLQLEGSQIQEQSHQSGSKGDHDQSLDSRLELEKRAKDANAKVIQLQGRLAQLEKAKRDEADKLNRDIGELEALCEATVWRREEQEAKREELERKVAQLQQQLADVGMHLERPDSAATSASTAHAEQYHGEQARMSYANGQEKLRHDKTASIVGELTCDDCGETGHKMEACPYVTDDMLF